MDTWSIVKASLAHCGGALLVGGAFAGTAYLFKFLFPNDVLSWWIGQIELVLAIFTVTALGIIFLNSLIRLVYDAIITTWKGISNEHHQALLA